MQPAMAKLPVAIAHCTPYMPRRRRRRPQLPFCCCRGFSALLPTRASAHTCSSPHVQQSRTAGSLLNLCSLLGPLLVSRQMTELSLLARAHLRRRRARALLRRPLQRVAVALGPHRAQRGQHAAGAAPCPCELGPAHGQPAAGDCDAGGAGCVLCRCVQTTHQAYICDR